MTFCEAMPSSKKLRVIFRMEPGSLGPDGNQYIKEFCDFAQQQLQACAQAYLVWTVEPRFDKSLSEIEYHIAAKKLSRGKACQYLSFFGENLECFEEQLEDNFETIINQYFGR